MDIKQLLESERENITEIRLYKEGMFFRAYEHSAYALQQVATLKPTRKESKALGVTYVSVGFPVTSLDKYVKELTTVSASEDSIVLRVPDVVAFDKFEEWKESVALNISSPTSSRKRGERINGKGVIEELEMFDLSIHTPIDCMVFLSDIKMRMCKDAQ